MFFSLIEIRGDANKNLFIHLYNCTPFVYYIRRRHLFARGKETVLEVLLALPFGVHGIENRLPLRLIPLPQFLDLALHFRVQASHSLLQFLVREKLQLQDIVVSLYIYIFRFFSLLFDKNVSKVTLINSEQLRKRKGKYIRIASS